MRRQIVNIMYNKVLNPLAGALEWSMTGQSYSGVVFTMSCVNPHFQ